MKRRVDELCAHVSELRGELSSLRQSAIAHVDQQQQKGEEVKESAASSTNSTRTLTGKSKPRANSEKKYKQQAEHVGTHTEPRTRSAATPWHAGKTVPSVDTETEYNVMYSNAEGTELLPVKNSKPVFSTITDDSWKLVSAGPPKTPNFIIIIYYYYYEMTQRQCAYRGVHLIERTVDVDVCTKRSRD